MNSVPTSKLTFNGKLYKVISTIFHVGNTMKSGHYNIMLRKENDKGWWLVSDQNVSTKRWPNGAKNGYIFVLE